MENELKQLLLQAPENQIDPYIKNYIRLWPEDPSSIDILYVLDLGIKKSQVSDFVVKILEIMLKESLIKEKITYDELLNKAHWRNI